MQCERARELLSPHLDGELSAEERRVLLDHGTEPPFCGGLLSNKEAGVYACRLCGLPLFRSTTKFESGTGWPSFYESCDPDHITYLRDRSYGMERVEIRCRPARARRAAHVSPTPPEERAVGGLIPAGSPGGGALS